MIYIATDNFNDGFPLSNAYDDVIYQKANSEYYLKFRYPIDRIGVWKNLTCETVLKADDVRGMQLFKIKKVNRLNGYVRIYAKHITDDINYIAVDKLAVSNATGKRVMQALAGSVTDKNNFVFDSDIATMHSLNLTNTTVGKIISKDKHSIIGQWGGELIRDNFLLDLKSRAGVDTEILFMNKKNVKNLDNSISTENLITRLKLSVEIEKEDNKKEIITATVDSPNINKYQRIYSSYLKVNSKNITNKQQLIEYGNRYFDNNLIDFPSDNLTVNVIDKNQERVNLFDTVWFRNVEFGIDKRLKVVAYEYSPMSRHYKKISFGALKLSNLSQIKSLSQLDERIEEKVNENFIDGFKIQENLKEIMRLDRTSLEAKMQELEEQSKSALEVKKALFDKDGAVPETVRTKILDAVEGDIGRLKTIITEAELIEAIQAQLNFAKIKNALIDKAFIKTLVSDESFRQEFEAGEVNTQNIFTKMKDSIQSNIRKDFITKEETEKLVNDLTIGADGIRQITQAEVVKVFENRKSEFKGEQGTSSYIHKKYSNNSDGRGMNDNSNSTYIGIYAGTSKTAPADHTQYSWTKIKGEDGRKGEDGKVPNFNLLINSEILDENAFKTNGGNFKLNKGDYNGKNSIEIINNNLTSPAFLGVYFRSSKTSFKKGDKAVLRLPMYIYSDIPVDNGMFIIVKDEKTGTVPYVRSITNRDPRDKWFVIEEKLEALKDFDSTDDYIFKVYTNNNGHFKLAEPYFALGEEVPKEWMPSLEDLKAHSLTANVRISGAYEGAKTSGVKFFVDVFYDGKKVTDGFKLTAKVQGAGLNKTQENATYNSTGELTNVYYSDGEKDGTPITIQLDVEYNYIKTTCFARLDNLPSPELVKEVISKYKTFDSTLEQFKSEIGEITNKQFKVAVRNKQLANLPSLRTGNSLYFYTSENMEKGKVYTFIADIRKFPENQSVRITSDINTSKQKLRYGWNFFVFQARENNKAINLDPLGEGTEVKDVEVWEGNFNHMLGEDVFDGIVGSLSSMLSIQTKNTYSEGRFYKVVFDLAIPIQGAMSINAIDYIGGNVPRNAYYPLTTKDNVQYAKVDSKSNTNKDIIRLEFTQNVSPSAITNVRVYEIQLGIRYADKNEIVNISSLIDQAKDEIALSVKETYMSKIQAEATLKIFKDKVETAVTDKEFGTKLIQNAYSLRLAWNAISDYVQFENGGMSFYNESIAKSKLRARIDGGNYQFWRDGYTLGDMGTGVFIGDPNKKGIQFHLEYDGWFMGWSYKDKRTDDSYTWKWVYTSGNFGPYKTDTLNAGCDINCQWNQLYYFETRSDWLRVKDGISDTIRVKGVDDSIYTLKIRNGLLVR